MDARVNTDTEYFKGLQGWPWNVGVQIYRCEKNEQALHEYSSLEEYDDSHSLAWL